MPRSADATRTRILAAAYQLLYREGFSRSGMDSIARAAGLTKKALYYHFDSKDALVAAMLEQQHEQALSLFRGWADPLQTTPGAFVATLFEKLERWASGSPWYGSGFTRLTMELADLPGHPVRRAAQRHKLAVETWLSEELAARGHGASREAARDLMLLIEGCLSLTLIHRDVGYVRAAAATAGHLVRAAA